MMRKPTGHKERYVIKSEISRSNDDGTCARTRPFSYDEIMLRRKNKKESGSVEDQRVASEVVSGRVESDRNRHRDDDEYNKQDDVKEPKKVISRTKEDRSTVREDKMVEGEYKESNNARRVLSKVVSGKDAEGISGRVESDRRRHKHREGVGDDERYASDERLKVSSQMEEDKSKMRDEKIQSKIGSDNVKDRKNERGGHEKRKNPDRSTYDFDNEHEKRRNKDSAVIDRDRKADRDKNAGRDRNVDGDRSVGRDRVVDRDRNDGRDRNIEQVRNVEKDRNVDRDRNIERDRVVDRDRNHGRDRNIERDRNVEKDRNVDRDRNVERDRNLERDRNVGRDRNIERERNVEGVRNLDRDRNIDRDRNVNRDRNVERESNVDRDRNTERDRNVDRDRNVERDKNVDQDRNVVRDRNVERDRNVDRDRNFERDRNGERDRNVERDIGKSEHVTKKRTQNVNDEWDRDHDTEKKHDLRKEHDSNSSEKKEKETSESRHEELKVRSKRSRSREHERDKRRRSNSPSSRGHKRVHDVREHEDPSSHASKDRAGRFDSNVDRKKLSNNGSSNKSKRHDTSASRLGGYSPRKRRSEAAVRTPSPTSRSPEKKSASSNKTAPSIKNEVSSAVPFTPVVPRPTFGVFPNIPLMMNTSVDSVQLTQATRPKRRIYVENLPSSASDADVMKWLSGYLRPSGFNLVQGPSPCISCIVNKEKGQAVVEFLTPEDASTALSFDGRSFSGNIVKIRRPKDYVEATTGVSEKPVAGAVSVKNVVEDSPNKIFIGGISKVITSKMLMEVASAFGPIKAYHFEENAHPDSPFAFVEYGDQSVTVKACAGLNGMKLGGRVLTVTQATPDPSSVENHGEQPSYGTPLHARPLLETPTQVLKLTNVLDPHSLSILSEPELEEILEDIRLECARFGMVKSINIIKQTNMPTSSETVKTTEESNSMADEAKDDGCKETGSQSSDSDKEQPEEVEEPADKSSPIGDTNEPEKVNGSSGDNGIVSKEHENNMAEDETYDTTMVDSVPENENLENSNQISSAIGQLELDESKPVDDIEMENKSLKLEMVSIDQPENESKQIDDIEMETTLQPEMVPESHDNMKDVTSDLNDLFELGCVLVEYKRTEASTIAAHCLHGRNFDGRTVSVEYVAPDAYSTRFRK